MADLYTKGPYSGADPGPVVRGGTNPSKGGRQPNIFFCEKPHEIKGILVCRAGAPEVPSLRSATDIVVSLDF